MILAENLVKVWDEIKSENMGVYEKQSMKICILWNILHYLNNLRENKNSKMELARVVSKLIIFLKLNFTENYLCISSFWRICKPAIRWQKRNELRAISSFIFVVLNSFWYVLKLNTWRGVSKFWRKRKFIQTGIFVIFQLPT